MFNLIGKANRTLRFAFWASASAVCMPTLATAQEITLRTDAGVTVTGQLVEFKDNIYVIDSELGRLNVRGDQVECIGDGCPGNAEAGAVVWEVSLWGSRRAFTEHVEKIAELVDEKTNGDFTLNLNYGGLAAPRENLDGIAAGDFEVAQFCAGYHPEKNPSLNVLELPFLGVSSFEEELAITRAVYAHPFTIADMARWNATLLMPSPQPQQNIMGTGQPPTSLSDFEDMAIRATGGIGDAVAAMGATPVIIPAPTTAEAMATGEVRAVSFAPHAHMAFGTIENGSWWTKNLNPGTAHCPIVVNTAALEGLSPLHREALLSSVDAALDHYVDYYTNVTLEAWFPALIDNGIIELSFNDEILSAINARVAAPTAALWIIENSANGLPAQELYGLVVDTLSQ